ncbi:MAG: acyl-CoA thioesterase [Anaerolineales bacterium]|nr:acyl-CoA thioesterase [Anaerolineales bacterium]
MRHPPVEKKILSLDEFPFQTYDKLRYADTDRQGHVNNAVFSTYFETGRMELLYDSGNPLASEGEFVIASLKLDFLAEVHWPGRIEIGTGVREVGNSSFRLAQALFQDGRRVAAAETVIVQIDERTRKSCPLSEKTRTFLTAHLLP